MGGGAREFETEEARVVEGGVDTLCGIDKDVLVENVLLDASQFAGVAQKFFCD